MAEHTTPSSARPVRRALISVSDKTGIVEFARELAARGVALLSTGGTFRLLSEHGIPVTEVSQHTGFPEIMDGRVKTLQPKIHGGILARRGDPDHLAAMAAHDIAAAQGVHANLAATTGRVSLTTMDQHALNIFAGGRAD